MISKGIRLTGTYFQEIVPCGDFCVVHGERGGERMGKGEGEGKREREKGIGEGSKKKCGGGGQRDDCQRNSM